MTQTAPVRRTQAERTAATRAALLAATVDVLVARGYRGTTTQDVARRAGVSYGALLHHFPTKADLLSAALEHVLEARIAEFRKAMADLPPGTATREAAIDVLWSMVQGPTFTAWLEMSVAARTDTALAQAFEGVAREFAETSVEQYREMFPEDAAADPELPRIAIAMLFTFLDGLALARLVPGCELITPEQALDVFKLLISSALPATEETP